MKNHTAPTEDQLEFGATALEKIIGMKRELNTLGK